MEFNATFLVAFVSFVLFTVIMNLILYKPINKVVSERQEFLDGSYKAAQKAKEQTHIVISDKEDQIGKTKLDAKRIIADETEKSKNKKYEITANAQEQMKSQIETEKSKLKEAKEKVQGELSNEVVNIAQVISAKILGEEIPIAEPNKDLITKIMQES